VVVEVEVVEVVVEVVDEVVDVVLVGVGVGTGIALQFTPDWQGSTKKAETAVVFVHLQAL